MTTILTALEKEVLLAILYSDYQCNEAPVNNPVWWLEADDVDMLPRQLPGAISSCSKKGYVGLDKSVRGEETIWLTQKGFDILNLNK